MVDKRAIRRAYDELAEEYAATRSAHDPGMTVLEAFLRDGPTPEHVLDAGCGHGVPVLSRLAEAARPIGLDFSREQLRLAADHLAPPPLIQGDLATLPFERETFDAVVAFWSLIHVPADDQQTVLDEFARVLCSDGRLLVCDGTNPWRGEHPDWLDTGVPMAWDIAGVDATTDQLRTAGFVIEERWGVPETLEDEDGEIAEVGDPAEHPWTFVAARLDG